MNHIENFTGLYEPDLIMFLKKPFNISHIFSFMLRSTQSTYWREHWLVDLRTGVRLCEGWKLWQTPQGSLLCTVFMEAYLTCK